MITPDHGRGDRLKSFILSCEDKKRIGESSNALLNEIFNGYPPSSLTDLIGSENDVAAAEGAWILTEIGALGRELVDLLPYMIEHQYYVVRYWAVDAILLHANTDMAWMAISLLNDEADAVREYAIIQFAKIGKEVFAGARKNGLDHDSSRYRLLETILEEDPETLRRSLVSPDIGIRSAAAVAALRSADLELLSAVEASSDEVISRAGAEFRELHSGDAISE